MIKGILFDKDGTLIDFSLWRDASINVIKNIMSENGIKDDKIYKSLIRSIGVTETGVEPFGALAYKPHEDVAAELHFVLSKNNINLDFNKFRTQIVKMLRNEVMDDKVSFKEMTNLKSLFSFLRSKDIKVGMATADSYQSAMHMVNKLDLNDDFDFIGSNDGILKPKPHNDMCLKFCHEFKLQPNEVVIVGDSYNDMIFARNSGSIALGVLSGVSDVINLKDVADVIVPTIDCLYDEEVLNELLEDKNGVRELWTA